MLSFIFILGNTFVFTATPPAYERKKFHLNSAKNSSMLNITHSTFSLYGSLFILAMTARMHALLIRLR